MLILAVVISLISVTILPPTATEVAERFEEAMLLTSDFRTRIRMSMCQPLVWDLSTGRPSEDQRPDGYMQVFDIRSAYWRDHLRHDGVLDETGVAGGQPLHSAWTAIWTGIANYRFSRDDSVIITDITSAAVMVREAGLFDLLAGRYPQHTDLWEQIRTGETVDSRVENNVLVYRFRPPGVGNVVLTVIADWEPDFRLREFGMEVSGAGQPNQNRLIIDEWGDYDGLVLPKTARVVGASYNSPGYDTKCLDLLTLYERIECERIDASADLSKEFSIAYQPRMRVIDSRMNLSFQIGSDIVALDGVLYRLRQPLLDHPGERLAELLKDAEIISRVPAATLAGTPTQRPTSWKPILVALLAAGGTAIAAFGLLRMRSKGRRASS